MTNAVPDLIASCWTAGGNADAADGMKPSPVDLRTRIEAAARIGWRGFGLMYPDLIEARETLGFADLKKILDDNGILHLELEYLEDWWETGAARAQSDAMRRDLLDAVALLRPCHIKIGAGVTVTPIEFDRLRNGWAKLCEDAEAAGVSVAIEAAPYSHLPTVESMVRLVTEVNHPRGGLCLDIWHIYRSGMDYGALPDLVPRASVFAVELSDAQAQVRGTLREDTINNRKLCGEGDADVVGFINVVDRIGFDGPWGVEIISDAHRARPVVEALEAAFATTAACFCSARSGNYDNRAGTYWKESQ